MNGSNKVRNITIMGMFSAIIILLAFTPLGFIPLPFMRMTTIHIPVIIGSLFLGPKYGAALGFLFGLCSLYINTTAPGVTSFVFSPFIPVLGTEQGSPFALLVVFIPRILVGVVPWFVNAGLEKVFKKNYISYAISGIAGSMTNTLFVMHGIFLFFREPWGAARPEPVYNVYPIILSIIAINGIPEAIGAGILVSAIGTALAVVLKRAIKNG